MKLKDVFLGLCVAALLVGEIFLFSANRQKDLAQSALRDARQQISQLQKDLQQATNENAAARTSEFLRLRTENQQLPKLRGQIRQLTSTNQQLLQQLEYARADLQQQQQQLQELQAQNQQVEAASAQTISQADIERNECINNLREIEGAKAEWALENNKNQTATPTVQDLLPYLRGNIFPTCPSGGTYIINPVNELPTCSIPGHTLSPQ